MRMTENIQMAGQEGYLFIFFLTKKLFKDVTFVVVKVVICEI